jgi:hypothetical protein
MTINTGGCNASKLPCLAELAPWAHWLLSRIGSGRLGLGNDFVTAFDAELFDIDGATLDIDEGDSPQGESPATLPYVCQPL